jgi:hypothetical protein
MLNTMHGSHVGVLLYIAAASIHFAVRFFISNVIKYVLKKMELFKNDPCECTLKIKPQ